MNDVLFRVEADLDTSRELTRSDLTAVADSLIDVSTLDERRRGVAIRLRDLVEWLGVADAQRINFFCSADDYQVDVALSAVIDRGLLIFGLDEGPLPNELGGPVRFWVPDAADCNTAEVDACGNVKGVDRLTFGAS